MCDPPPRRTKALAGKVGMKRLKVMVLWFFAAWSEPAFKFNFI